LNAWLLAVALTLVASGCGVWRGIPSHGGGKRFDEEQRVVAAAVRRTLADMDLSELRGKRVAITLDSIANDGGGNISFPGFTGVSGGASANEGDGISSQITPGLAGQPSWINSNSNSGYGGNVGFHYRAETSYGTHGFSTSPDVAYLKAALEMKARHAGLLLTGPGEPEVMLYVLVDVLGTNRSHRGGLVGSTETLLASCECTYYAHDPKSGHLVFEARRASSAASYAETRRIGNSGPEISRTIARTPPTPLPVNEHQSSTRPASVAEKKPWIEGVWRQFAGAGE
jgi:hypothetical protein